MVIRDVVVNAILEDMLAGRAVVYADFVGYDEVAHHSGIERFDTLEVLRSIDQQIGRLWRAAQLAPRPYHLVLPVRPRADPGADLRRAVRRDRRAAGRPALRRPVAGAAPARLLGLLPPAPAEDSRRPAESWQVDLGAGRGRRARSPGGCATGSPGPVGPRRSPRSARPGAVTRVAPGVVVSVSGHMAQISFPDVPGRVPLETIERRWPDLLPALVDHGGIGFLLVHSAEFGPVVLGRDGLRRLRTDVVIGEDPLIPYGEHAAALVARVSASANCADVVLNSRYDPETDEASPFEPHVGSHGGLGGPQQHGFLVHPRGFADPGEIVGAEQLHRVLRGWLTDLGHPEPPLGHRLAAVLTAQA